MGINLSKYPDNQPGFLEWLKVAGILGVFIAVILLVLFGVSSMVYADEPSEVVLQTIAMESANQPMEGQIAVAHVIINRARQRHQTLDEVCLAPKQFSAWNSRITAQRWIDKYYTASTRDKAIQAYHGALIGNSTYPNINHYHTVSIKPYWAKGRKPDMKIGSHVFYAL